MKIFSRRLVAASGFLALAIACPLAAQTDGKSPSPVRLETIDDVRYSPALTLENECMPPFYRKIALNGRPISDQRPQDRPRVDQEPEETYIDALTLQLHHNVTDIYVPLFAQKLSLAVRRNATGMVWNDDESLPPNRRPDMPFGPCWTTGLAANIHIIEGDPRDPVYAKVTDEEGTVHRFLRVYDSKGKIRYLPLPTATNEQDSSMLELTRKDNGDFVFRRKFGTALLFQGRQPIIIKSQASTSNPQTSGRHLFYRLFKVSDGSGAWIEYSYLDDNNTLVPDEISFKSQHILIEKNLDGYIGTITDPLKRKYHYTYRKSILPQGGFLLTRVEVAHNENVSSATIYTYEELSEAILSRSASGQSSMAYHCNITRITDPIGSSYAFDYEPDRSRIHFEGNDRIISQGLQRLISHVQLPDDLGPVNLSCYSEIVPPLRGSSRRLTFIVDAAGNGRLYRFLDNEVISFNATNLNAPGSPEIVRPPRVATYKTLEVSHFDGDEHSLTRDGLNLTPEGTTRLIGTEAFEFDIGAAMNLSKATDMWGNTTRFRYDETRQDSPHAEDVSPALSNPFATRYGDPTSQTNPLNGIRYFSYEPSRRFISQIIDEAGHITRYDVDSTSGAVRSVTAYTGEAQLKKNDVFSRTEYDFDKTEFPLFCTRKTVQKIGTFRDSPPWETDLITEYEADSLGRVSSMVEDPKNLKQKTSYRYDSSSNLISRTYPNGTVIEFLYDNRNRLTRAIYDGRAAKEFVYDRRGNKLRETDPDGTNVMLDYDSLNRIARKRVKSRNSDGDPVETITDYTYNAVNAKISEEVNRQGKTIFSYDGLQRLSKIEMPNGNSVRYAYGRNSGATLFADTSFLPTTITEGNNSPSDIEYDGLYRKRALIERPYKMLPFFTQRTKYEYDALGNLLREIDQDGRTTTREYDPLNRQIRLTTAAGKSTRTLFTSTGLEYATVDASANVRETVYDSTGKKVVK